MKILEHLEGFFSSKLSEVSTFVTLAKLEAKLAELSLMPLLISIGALFVIALSVWFLSMILLWFAVMHFVANSVLAIAIILLINLGLLGVLAVNVVMNFKKIRFEKTRKYLSNTKQGVRNVVEKRIASTNSKDGKDATDPAC